MITGDEVIGVLHVRSKEIGAYSDRDLGLIEQVGRQIAPAVDNAQRYEQLKEGKERLRILSGQFVDVQEAERRHLARELHDEMGQVLSGLRLNLEAPAWSHDDASLEQTKSLVDELMWRVQEIALDLRPSMLDDTGLVTALIWYFRRYTDRTQVDVDYQHDGLDRRPKAEVETTAYRVVQEALTNVARHAIVSCVSVQMWSDGLALNLHIQDHAVGFDVKSVMGIHQNIGLEGMRERAILLGGQLTIEATPGADTQIFADLPLSGLDHTHNNRDKN